MEIMLKSNSFSYGEWINIFVLFTKYNSHLPNPRILQVLSSNDYTFNSSKILLIRSVVKKGVPGCYSEKFDLQLMPPAFYSLFWGPKFHLHIKKRGGQPVCYIILFFQNFWANVVLKVLFIISNIREMFARFCCISFPFLWEISHPICLKFSSCYLWVTAAAQWLRCCATNRNVVGSIPAGVSGFFIDVKSFRSHCGPGIDSASNRNEYQDYFLG
jgi:hypothetical protein